MSVPLYFAADCEEIVTISENQPRALTGCGVFADGSARIPDLHVEALRVIDDAVVPERLPDKAALDTLAEGCAQGCFFDFLRKPTEFHRALLDGLKKRLPENAPFFVPQRYLALAPQAVCVLSPTLPQNCWEAFAFQAKAEYPRGWCLELIPWSLRVPLKAEPKSARRLPCSCCLVERRADGLLYFDTPQTLHARFSLAQHYGCIAGIALNCEMKE